MISLIKTSSKIKKAVAHQVEELAMQKNGRWLLTGMTREKVEIEIVVEKTGELVTAYPKYPEGV